MKYLFTIALIIMVSVSCQNSGSKKAVPVSDIHEVKVTEVLQAGTYTYLHVAERGREEWLAVPSMMAEVGDKYYYVEGLVMENFASKELDRVFERVLFLEQVYETPPSPQAQMAPQSQPMQDQSEHTGAIKDQKMNFTIEPLEDGITIAELYSGKKNYNGKTVKIRGAVTKFNAAIMDKNWIHIQDGSESDGKFDLTVTTDQVVQPGEVITVEGKITLDKDFGYGYFYEVLMEDAKIGSEL